MRCLSRSCGVCTRALLLHSNKFRFHTHDLRREFAETTTNSHGAAARALRRGFAKVKTNSHGATARAFRHARSPQRVRRARRHSESASTRTISAEGSPSSRQICTPPKRERLDTHDLRRSKFAWRHSESASTRTISAEGYVS